MKEKNFENNQKMNELNVLMNIAHRLNYDIVYQTEGHVEIQTESYELLSIDFDKNGNVIAIY